jgi:hypothetical protein
MSDNTLRIVEANEMIASFACCHLLNAAVSEHVSKRVRSIIIGDPMPLDALDHVTTQLPWEFNLSPGIYFVVADRDNVDGGLAEIIGIFQSRAEAEEALAWYSEEGE